MCPMDAKASAEGAKPAGVTGWTRARGCGRIAERVPGGPGPQVEPPMRRALIASRAAGRGLRHLNNSVDEPGRVILNRHCASSEALPSGEQGL